MDFACHSKEELGLIFCRNPFPKKGRPQHHNINGCRGRTQLERWGHPMG